MLYFPIMLISFHIMYTELYTVYRAVCRRSPPEGTALTLTPWEQHTWGLGAKLHSVKKQHNPVV